MLRFPALIAFLGCAFFATAQDYDAQISGYISYDTGEKLPDVSLTLYQGNDSITSVKTVEDGTFFFELQLYDRTDYVLKIVQGLPDYLLADELKINTEMHRTDFFFDIVYPEPTTDHFGGQIAFYQDNETKKFEEFEVRQILDIIRKYPDVCIQFSQTLSRSENEKTAEKRKLNFLKFLSESGVDMSCIRFDETTRILQAFQEDQRSRIQGAIYSMEGRCE